MIFGAIVALFLAFTPICTDAQSTRSAQNQQAKYSVTPRGNRSQVPSVETTQLVSVNLFGSHYGYEYPLGRLTSVTGRAGLEFGASWGVFSDNVYWLVVSSIDIEPRWYYGLDRRAALGRDTGRNAGSFVALRLRNILPVGYVSNLDLSHVGSTTLSPLWGFRRVWSDMWLLEFTTGLNFSVYWQGGEVDWSPALNVRFGYTF